MRPPATFNVNPPTQSTSSNKTSSHNIGGIPPSTGIPFTHPPCRAAGRLSGRVDVHQDGLVHISQLADRFVKNPSEVVKVQQKVTVTVLDVDLARKRISLSMRSNPVPAPLQQRGGQD